MDVQDGGIECVTQDAWACREYVEDFERLVETLPVELSKLAVETGSVTYWRQLGCGENLLRLLFLYGLRNMSLASVSAAALFLDVHLSPDALRARFRKAEPFLASLLSTVLLGEEGESSADNGMRLRLHDASTLQRPGTSTTDWLLHAVYELGRQRLVYFQLTDNKAPESLARSPQDSSGWLYVADRGLGTAEQVHISVDKDAYCLLRVHLPNIRLLHHDRELIDLDGLLDAADDGHQDTHVLVPLVRDKDKEPIPARLLIVPLPEEAAARARQKVRAKARKRGRTPDKRTLKLAGYLTLLTTLPSDVASPQACCACYRCRWAIERFFKQCKSILNLSQLTRSHDLLSRVQILAKLLLVALIQRRIVVEPLTSTPHSSDRLPPSVWKQIVLLYHAFTIAILPRALVSMLSTTRHDVLLRLSERPRTRRTSLESHAEPLHRVSSSISDAQRRRHNTDPALSLAA